MINTQSTSPLALILSVLCLLFAGYIFLSLSETEDKTTAILLATVFLLFAFFSLYIDRKLPKWQKKQLDWFNNELVAVQLQELNDPDFKVILKLKSNFHFSLYPGRNELIVMICPQKVVDEKLLKHLRIQYDWEKLEIKTYLKFTYNLGLGFWHWHFNPLFKNGKKKS